MLKFKNNLLLVFKVLLILVLIAKISNWFLSYPPEINKGINTAMFTLIGIAYIVMGIIWDGKLVKAFILFCGLFLIIMNFFSGDFVNILGIACLLTPMLIARFSKAPQEANA